MKYKFIGKGKGFIDGVPARDISAEEFDGLSPELQKAVEKTGLYEADYPAPVKEKDVKNG